MKQFLLVLLMFFMISSSFANNEEYTFIIEFDHDFDENEDIECEVIYDDRDKTLDFDEDSENEDFIYENEFEKYLSVECDSTFDEIEVEIIDENNDRITKFDYDDTNGFEYELDLVDEDEKWFKFILDHEFSDTEDIDCDLEIDSTTYDYEFTKDSENYEFARNYNNNIELDCDGELDEITLIVYNDNEQEEFRKIYTFDDRVTFDSEDLEVFYEFRLEFNHDFNSNDDIACDIIIDSVINEEINFNEDSRSSETRYIDDFKETLDVDCNEDVDEILLIIYQDLGEELISKIYEEEDNIEYDISVKKYGFFIIIEDEFKNKESQCELFIDGRSDDIFTLDSSSSLIDKRLNEDFNEELKFVCDTELDSIIFLVYEEDESNGNIVDETYKNKKEVSYLVNNQIDEKITDKEIIEEPITIVEEPVVEEIIIEEPVTEEEVVAEEKEENKPLETTQINAQVDQKTQNTIDSNIVDTNAEKQKIRSSDSTINSNDNVSSSSLNGWFLVFLIIFAIIVIIGLGYRNVPSTSSKGAQKSRNTKKKDIDFSFLNKKK